MRKLILGCAMALVAELAQADGYITTEMTTECGFRGFMAYQVNLGKQVADGDILYNWIKAVATSEQTQSNVMYPAFKSWFEHTTLEQMRAWVAKMVQYPDPVTALQKERLACEKFYAGELTPETK